MLKLYNTLTKTIEPFKPLNPQRVTMYSCGPTVYDYQHIGHMRRYVGDDVLIRILKFNGFQVDHVMNITDVGHLVSDSDEGEDKMEKGARKYGESVWEVARRFEKQFIDSCEALLIGTPTKLMHATDYIKEQIGLIQALEKKDFTYRTQDGIYFDTGKFPHYFQLSRESAKGLKAGVRVEMIEEKRHVTDFALWKFSPKDEKRQMEWESPWGVGFPGWHIECSAMSLEGLFHCFVGANNLPRRQAGHLPLLRVNLVQTIDIHTGGIDHIPIHHTNEIAQSEAATNKQFVKYWVHHNFLQVEGEKMSKSLGNIYTVQDVMDKALPAGRQGYDPMSLRYLYLQTHYRQEMNFTWESLEAADTALHRLRSEISKISPPLEGPVKRRVGNSSERINKLEFTEKFADAINDDMNMAKALATVWELVRSDVPEKEKVTSLIAMDNVLGLELFKQETVEIPPDVSRLVKQREQWRKEKNFQKSDELREEIKKLGYEVKDTKNGPKVAVIRK